MKTKSLKEIFFMNQLNRNFLMVMVLVMAGGFVHLPIQAQNNLLRYADKQFELENYAHSASLYSEAFKRKATYNNALMAARSFEKLQDYENSFDWWQTLVGFEEATKEDFSHYLQAALKIDDDFNIQDYLAGSPYSEFDFPEMNFDLIEDLKSRKANVKAVSLKEINSDASEYGTSIDQDGRIYFTSNRGETFSSDKPSVRLDARNKIFSEEKSDFSDMEYYGIYRYSTDGEIKKMSSDILGAIQYADPSLMESKNILFYTVFRNVRKVKGKRDFAVQPEIFFSEISDQGELLDSKPFPWNNLTDYGVMTPFVDEASRRIYFASDMPGGFGGFDLYYVSYDEDLNFGDPVNLGSSINTESDETHPSKDGDDFYFSSKGHPGLGGMDIFKASYQNDRLGNPVNMGAPFNTTRDDFAFYISPKGERFLSSDRSGGKGMDDIYLMEDLYKRLIARVIDCDGNIVSEDFETTLIEIDGQEKIPTSRADDFSILAELEPDKNFSLSIRKSGYFSIQDDELSTVGLLEDTLEREYRLAAIPYNMPVYVDIVYYDLDKSIIRPDANPTLDKIAELIKKYDFIDLIVNSHTDSRASNEYNHALSQRRADAVKEYLSMHSIDPSRVKLAWYGEENLVNDCGDGVPCPEVEHQLNRRSELVLEAFSDRDKVYELPKEFMGRDICDPADLFKALDEEINNVPTIYFDFDKANLRPVHKKELERVNLLLQKLSNLKLNIEGHTDQRGSEEYNMVLSERRAKIVMDYLTKKGIDPTRLKSEWMGKTQPIHDCETKDCTEEMHQLNRRTELQLINNK